MAPQPIKMLPGQVPILHNSLRREFRAVKNEENSEKKREDDARVFARCQQQRNNAFHVIVARFFVDTVTLAR